MTSSAGPRISVITVCLNAAPVIEATLRSVFAQNYANLEYVVVDGGSTDGTVEVIRRYADRLSAFVSEPDQGVYHAMNKGIDLARGEYLLFLNAGDALAAPDVISRTAGAADADVLYGDFAYSEGPRKGRVTADIDKGVFNHQCILYRKSLHAAFGKYFSVRGLTAADYLFFMHLRASGGASFRKLDLVLSVVDPHGMSAGLQTFLQVNLVDALLGRQGRYATVFRIAVHPVYDFFRSILRRLR
jgi:glycosyltransferase involved in cell wall biosynthesis